MLEITSAAATHPILPQTSRSLFCDKPARKPAANKSPAPVASTTLTGFADT